MACSSQHTGAGGGGSFAQIHLKFEDLPALLFKGNPNNARIHFDIDGIRCNRMLFMMLVDLLIKGCVLLHGNGTSVTISNLSMDDLDAVTQKMRNAGIVTHIGTIPVGMYNNEYLDLDPYDNYNRYMFIKTHADALHTMDDHLDLGEYKFMLLSDDNVIQITFEMSTT